MISQARHVHQGDQLHDHCRRIPKLVRFGCAKVKPSLVFNFSAIECIVNLCKSFLKEKADTFDSFQEICHRIIIEKNEKIIRVRSDRGGELIM